MGHFPHLIIIYIICLLFTSQLLRKPIKSYLSVLAVIPFSRSLVNTLCSSLGSTLLLIKRTAIDPLHLWVINNHSFYYAKRETILSLWSLLVATVLQRRALAMDPRYIFVVPYQISSNMVAPATAPPLGSVWLSFGSFFFAFWSLQGCSSFAFFVLECPFPFAVLSVSNPSSSLPKPLDCVSRLFPIQTWLCWTVASGTTALRTVLPLTRYYRCIRC